FPPQRLLSGGASHERQTLAARRTRLDGDDALGLGAFRPVDRIELHLCALGERLESVARDRRMVDEHVLATVSRGDEPIPLRIVEPLHGSSCHTNTSSTTKERAEDAHTAQPVLAQLSGCNVARGPEIGSDTSIPRTEETGGKPAGNAFRSTVELLLVGLEPAANLRKKVVHGFEATPLRARAPRHGGQDSASVSVSLARCDSASSIVRQPGQTVPSSSACQVT